MILIVAVMVVCLALRSQSWTWYESAVRGLGVGMILSAFDHIVQFDWYLSVMAEWLPNKPLLIQISIALRLMVGFGMMFRPTQHASLLTGLILMFIVLPVNLRIATQGEQIAAAAAMSPLWRWTRFTLHLLWIAWHFGTLHLLGLIYKAEAEARQLAEAEASNAKKVEGDGVANQAASAKC